MAFIALAGFTSCDPQESDDHSLGGFDISQDALAWTVSEVPDAKNPNKVTVTFTNTSQEIAGVKYYVTTDGKKMVEFPVGASTEVQIKKNGTYQAILYAIGRGDQKNLVWTKNVDWFPDVVEDKQFLGFTNGENLLAEWNPAEITTWFSGPDDWSGMAAPDVDGDVKTGISFTMNGAGSDQWKAQVHLNGNGPTLSAGKTYDFSIAIISTADNEAGVTVKPQKDGDDNTYLSAERHPIKAGVNVITLSDKAGFDGPFKLALDFAGLPEGAEVMVKNIFLSEHNEANVAAEGEATWAFDASSDANLLKGQDFGADFRFWFADGSWTQIGDPEFDGDPSAFSVVIPEGMGGDQWQGQIHMPFDEVNLSAGKNYNFSVVVIADNDVPGLTVKPQNDADDNAFLDDGRHEVKANVPTAIVLEAKPGFDGKFRLCLDLGGTAAGTKVQFLGAYLGESK